MVPDPNRLYKSFPQMQYPALRDIKLRTVQSWLKGKRLQDGAEGLWRIHDGLYDLNTFMEQHPGGAQWLSATKGTDITVAFETHHLNGVAETILPKYFVRKAELPKNYPFTFDEGGFYKTLKLKVAKKLKENPPGLRLKSDRVTDCLLLALIVISPLSCWAFSRSYAMAVCLIILHGHVLSSLAVCGHNYYHSRDNWRMYVYNLAGFSYEEWRIIHVLSHHGYTNTLQDFELNMIEPLLQYLPYKDKSLLAQMGALYWPLLFSIGSLSIMVKDFVTSIANADGKALKWHHMIPLLQPLWMYLLGGLPFGYTLLMWTATLLVMSLLFVIAGLTAGHHGNEAFFDGDIPRDKNPDWGLYQLDTVVERADYTGSHFKSLISFGDHALHHLFPTLDHAELRSLYPTLLDHCEKYKAELRMTTFYQAVWSQAKQLTRKEPNDFRMSINNAES